MCAPRQRPFRATRCTLVVGLAAFATGCSGSTRRRHIDHGHDACHPRPRTRLSRLWRPAGRCSCTRPPSATASIGVSWRSARRPVPNRPTSSCSLDCSLPHQNEVFDVLDLPGAGRDYPGEPAMKDYAASHVHERVRSVRRGRPTRFPSSRWATTCRLRSEWDIGSRRLGCLRVRRRTATSSSGSMRGSGTVNGPLSAAVSDHERRRAPLAEGRHALLQVLARPRACETARVGVVVVPSAPLSPSLWPADRQRGQAPRSVRPSPPHRDGGPRRWTMPEAMCGLAAVHLGGQQHGPGRSLAGDALQPVDGPLVHHQAELGGRDAELSVAGRHPQVARDRPAGVPSPRAAPFHGGDRRQPRRCRREQAPGAAGRTNSVSSTP